MDLFHERAENDPWRYMVDSWLRYLNHSHWSLLMKTIRLVVLFAEGLMTSACSAWAADLSA